MLSSLDMQITDFLSRIPPHNVFFNTIFESLSFVGSSLVLWVLLVVIIITVEYFQRKNKRAFTTHFVKFVLTFFLTLGLVWMLVTLVIKPIIGRDRPYQVLKIESVCPTDPSFPSGHAAAAWAGAYILAKFDHEKRRRWLYVFTAIGISYSRIYLLCHYLGDVVAGGLFGLMIGVIVYETIHRIYHKALSSKF